MLDTQFKNGVQPSRLNWMPAGGTLLVEAHPASRSNEKAKK
jgi:hypothetical protein